MNRNLLLLEMWIPECWEMEQKTVFISMLSLLSLAESPELLPLPNWIVEGGGDVET